MTLEAAAVDRLKRQASSSCLLQFAAPFSSSISYPLSSSIPGTSCQLSASRFPFSQKNCDPKYYDGTLDLYSWWMPDSDGKGGFLWIASRASFLTWSSSFAKLHDISVNVQMLYFHHWFLYWEAMLPWWCVLDERCTHAIPRDLSRPSNFQGTCPWFLRACKVASTADPCLNSLDFVSLPKSEI